MCQLPGIKCCTRSGCGSLISQRNRSRYCDKAQSDSQPISSQTGTWLTAVILLGQIYLLVYIGNCSSFSNFPFSVVLLNLFFWKCSPEHRINRENAAGIDQNVSSVFPIWLNSTDTPTLPSFSIFTLLTLCRGPICVLTRHPTHKVQDRLAHCPTRYGSRILPEGTGSSFWGQKVGDIA